MERELQMVKELLGGIVQEIRYQQTGRSSWFRSQYAIIRLLEEYLGTLKDGDKDDIKDMLHSIFTSEV